jgi:hypothetical protein
MTGLSHKRSSPPLRRAVCNLLPPCSHFVLMPVQTLREAWRLGWRIRADCYVISPMPKSKDRIGVFCDTTTEPDMKTLV